MKLKLIIIVCCISITFSACIEDLCNGKICQNDGVCVRGECACLQGYEGEECQLEWKDKFVESWYVLETDKKGNQTNQYGINTIETVAPDTFYLLNLANNIDTVVCYRAAFLKFAMIGKDLPDSVTLQSGDGTLSAETGKVSGVYTTSRAGISNTVYFTWTP